MSKDSLLLQPIKVGNLTFKNRIMFPPQTTGYEERDGSIGERSLNFYKRIAQGGSSYVIIGDVAPVMTASPTPKLCDDRQIPTFKRLADAMHEYDCKVALQIFHPEYDVPGVGRMIMMARKAMGEAQAAKEAGDMATFGAKMAEGKKLSDDAYAKLHHDMKHFVTEASVEQLNQIKEAIAQSARRAMEAGIDAIEIHGDRLLGSLCSTILNHRTDEYGGCLENRVRYALEVVAAIKEAAPTLMVEYKLPFITKNPDGSDRGKGGLHEEDGIKFAKMLEEAGVDMIQVAQANHTGNMADTIPPMGTREYNWMLPITRKVKETVSIPVAVVGKVVTVENGEKILADGDADIMLTYRTENTFVVTGRWITDKVYRVIGYSQDNTAMSDTEGPFFTLSLSSTSSLVAGDYTLMVDNVCVVTENALEEELLGVSTMFEVTKEQMTHIITSSRSALCRPADIFDAHGRLVRKAATSFDGLGKGIYIMNNQKYVRKLFTHFGKELV